MYWDIKDDERRFPKDQGQSGVKLFKVHVLDVLNLRYVLDSRGEAQAGEMLALLAYRWYLKPWVYMRSLMEDMKIERRVNDWMPDCLTFRGQEDERGPATKPREHRDETTTARQKFSLEVSIRKLFWGEWWITGMSYTAMKYDDPTPFCCFFKSVLLWHFCFYSF